MREMLGECFGAFYLLLLFAGPVLAVFIMAVGQTPDRALAVLIGQVYAAVAGMVVGVLLVAAAVEWLRGGDDADTGD